LLGLYRLNRLWGQMGPYCPVYRAELMGWYLKAVGGGGGGYVMRTVRMSQSRLSISVVLVLLMFSWLRPVWRMSQGQMSIYSSTGDKLRRYMPMPVIGRKAIPAYRRYYPTPSPPSSIQQDVAHQLPHPIPQNHHIQNPPNPKVRLTVQNPIPPRIKFPLSQTSSPTRIPPPNKISFFNLINPLSVALIDGIGEV
jgi:hypothetical protein